MLKIWAKTLVNDKITRDLMFKRFEKFDYARFMDYLVEVCYELDIPTPVVLKCHAANFREFNVARFRVCDFVERVDFEILVLENASD
ncbi:MAG: hypothetical protein FWD58_03495 [Firmicutes bacterium]|nr:hypothetical protein [Bacillota bacterium]